MRVWIRMHVGVVQMRCAVYARVSTDFDTQKTSIDNQIDMFYQYAEQHEWNVVKVYTDKKSGTKENRPGLKELIKDGKAGAFDVIVAKELSRLARNGRLSYELRDMCAANNIDIVCLDNSINTLTGDVQNFGLFAWLYENESTSTSRRNKAAKRMRAQRGLFVGSVAPYGYYSEEGVLKVRDDNSPNIVRRIYEMYLEGKGMDSIAKELTLEQVPTPSQVAGKANASHLWYSGTIKNILHNQHYCGDLVQNKMETMSVTSTRRRKHADNELIIHRNMHEPIITRELFESVQKQLKRNGKVGTPVRRNLYTQLLYCQKCGKAMWYRANQKGYRCGGNVKHGIAVCDNKTAVREKSLNERVTKELHSVYTAFQNEKIMDTFTTKLSDEHKHVNEQIAELSKQIKQLSLNKFNYVNLYTENLISKDEFIQFKELADEQLSLLENEREALEEQQKELLSERFMSELQSKLKYFFSLETPDIRALHSLIKRMTSDPEGNIVIQYNFANPFTINTTS